MFAELFIKSVLFNALVQMKTDMKKLSPHYVLEKFLSSSCYNDDNRQILTESPMQGAILV